MFPRNFKEISFSFKLESDSKHSKRTLIENIGCTTTNILYEFLLFHLLFMLVKPSSERVAF